MSEDNSENALESINPSQSEESSDSKKTEKQKSIYY